jgi:hypothetical protein
MRTAPAHAVVWLPSASGFHKSKNKDNGDNMKSRKHLRTILFVAAMLAIGTAMGAALLIERHGGGSQTFGKQDGARGGAGRAAHAPTATSGVYSGGPDASEETVQGGMDHWSPPGFVSWPHGATDGGSAHGSAGLDFVSPEYEGSYAHSASHTGPTYMIVGLGPDQTATGRVVYNRGTESAPSTASVFSGVPASLSPAPASGPAGALVLLPMTAPVPEPAEWMMLTAGLIFIGALTRRRSRQH